MIIKHNGVFVIGLFPFSVTLKLKFLVCEVERNTPKIERAERAKKGGGLVVPPPSHFMATPRQLLKSLTNPLISTVLAVWEGFKLQSVICDEFSVTLDLNYKDYEVDPNDYFERYSNAIESHLSLSEILSDKEHQNGGMFGYSHVITWGYDNKQVRFLYAPNNINMKMQLRFGASALRNYIKQYALHFGECISVVDILKMLEIMNEEQGGHTEVRLSRIDIAFDFIDEGITVPHLYRDINALKVAVFNKNNVNTFMNSFNGELDVNTLYFNKRTSASMLRIYNKKAEQMSKKDAEQFKVAFDCEDWTRFELELKHAYAHSITKRILDCNTEQEFQKVMAKAFVDCFKIRKCVGYDENQKEVYENIWFYEDMISFAESEGKFLSGVNYEQLTEFDQKYRNLFKNGTMPFFKMIEEAYGSDELDRFFDKVKKDLNGISLDRKQKTIVKANENTTPFF
jgi:hypothetical protein